MRLTLRTLLAYLDDTLEPAQAKLIGQKVAESTQAQELIEKIKEVTRRRRITAPTTAGHNIDANTIAEYLDNAVTPEQAGEVEQICLASEMHLAEVAASHQILALVLGEPAHVPPAAKQKMYGLVKGPEAIPFRKPAAPRPSKDGNHHDHDEADETLRMGLPNLGKKSKWSQALVVFGAGGVAATLLILAIVQVLSITPKVEPPAKGLETPVAQNDDKKAVEKPEPKDDGTKPKIKDDPKVIPPPAKEKEKEKVPEVKDLPPPFQPEAVLLPDIRYVAPDNRVVSLGKYVMPSAKKASVVIAGALEKPDWQRMWGNQLDVKSGQEYISLPGCPGDLQLTRGLKLTLWGTVPEILPAPPLLESAVILHTHDSFDVDLTLERGRIVLTSSKSDKPAIVRIRFENPTQPKEFEFIDMALEEPGTKILLDRWSFFPPGEPFYKDPKNPMRLGPAAGLGVFVLSGKIQLRMNDVTYTLDHPGRALIMWNSQKGLTNPQFIDKLPPAVSTDPPAPQAVDKKFRDDILLARDDLANVFLKDRAVDVGLTEAHDQAKDPAMRMMAVRCRGAIGAVRDLVDDLAEERHPEIRQAAIYTLRNWISSSRENEYVLFESLKARFDEPKKSTVGGVDSERIMELFHGVAKVDTENLDLLVGLLNNNKLIIREMAYMNLVAVVPAGREIQYDPTADIPRRQAAQKAWREVIRKNMAPPAGMK